MKFSIRAKMILAITTLIVVLLAAVSYLFIAEKRSELANDIYISSLAFSRLVSPSIAENYDVFLNEGAFVLFNKEMTGVFNQTADVSRIRIASYDGVVLYDSDLDLDRQYEGEPRLVDENLLKSIPLLLIFSSPNYLSMEI